MKAVTKFLLMLLVIATTINAQTDVDLKQFIKDYGVRSRGLSLLEWYDNANKASYVDYDEESESKAIIGFDCATGEESVIVTVKKLRELTGYGEFDIADYYWSADNNKILLTTFLHYRYQKPGGRVYVYDVNEESVTIIPPDEGDKWVPQFSPNADKVGYVKENNIYIYDLVNDEETQVTFDGTENIINGQFDWVYQEELDVVEGWYWSPDGKKIAFWQLDQSNVPGISIAKWDSLYFNFMEFRYPKAGAPNSVVKVGVYDLESGETTWMDLGEETDVYIPRIMFADNETLTVQRLSRLQNKLELLFCDVETGSSETVVTEKSEAWVEVDDDLLFMPENGNFIWSSERDGYNHLYLYNAEGELVNQITKGEWEVKELLAVDAEEEKVYYLSNERGAVYTDLYSVSFDGTDKMMITEEAGTHKIRIPMYAPKYYIDSFSSVKQPPEIYLGDVKGNKLKEIVTSSTNIFEKYGLNYAEFMQFETTDGVMLNAYMIKPVNFDENKEYPVLISIYGGPGSQKVVNSYRMAGWHYYLSMQGYIVFSFDNRGTGGRGTEFRHLMYKQLGKWEINDTEEAAKYLQSLPYVNKDRMGIWGWSYGGYVSALAMAKLPQYFKAGISVAPVTDWHFYDNIYTERFMSLPSLNTEGYEESSVLKHAGNIEGELLLVHGTADDNVHVQNTIKLIDVLIDKDVQFDLMLYPERNHSIYGGNTTYHLYRMFNDFILENL